MVDINLIYIEVHLGVGGGLICTLARNWSLCDKYSGIIMLFVNVSNCKLWFFIWCSKICAKLLYKHRPLIFPKKNKDGKFFSYFYPLSGVLTCFYLNSAGLFLHLLYLTQHKISIENKILSKKIVWSTSNMSYIAAVLFGCDILGLSN